VEYQLLLPAHAQAPHPIRLATFGWPLGLTLGNLATEKPSDLVREVLGGIDFLAILEP